MLLFVRFYDRQFRLFFIFYHKIIDAKRKKKMNEIVWITKWNIMMRQRKYFN